MKPSSLEQDLPMAETDAPILLKDLAEGVLRLTMNRPGARNALSMEMLEALQAALDESGDDPNVRAIIIAAEGPGFCGGHDLKQMTGHRDDDDGGRAWFGRRR